MRPKRFWLGMIMLSLPVWGGCFSQLDLGEKHLSTALLGEPYEYHFSVQAGWADFWDNTFTVRLLEGDLPSGMGITADGELIGTPQELGNFEFRVIVYDEDFDSDTESFSDDEWFSLFVTEPSTNEDCPAPNNETVVEIALCLGNVEEESFSAGDSFPLDVTYYVNLKEAIGYEVGTLSFTVGYDAENFEVDEEKLNSTILREVATRSKATVDFDASVPGTLEVTVKAEKGRFARAGRVMNLPFVAQVDLEAGDYPFTVTIQDILSDDPEAVLPPFLEIDGMLTVESSPEDE